MSEFEAIRRGDAMNDEHLTRVKHQQAWNDHHPECSCGWIGSYWKSANDAGRDAERHKFEMGARVEREAKRILSEAHYEAERIRQRAEKVAIVEAALAKTLTTTASPQYLAEVAIDALLADGVPTMADCPNAEDIVRGLAAIEDPTVEDRVYSPSSQCGLCGAADEVYKHAAGDSQEHDSSCPWRLAVEWVKVNDPR